MLIVHWLLGCLFDCLIMHSLCSHWQGVLLNLMIGSKWSLFAQRQWDPNTQSTHLIPVEVGSIISLDSFWCLITRTSGLPFLQLVITPWLVSACGVSTCATVTYMWFSTCVGCAISKSRSSRFPCTRYEIHSGFVLVFGCLFLSLHFESFLHLISPYTIAYNLWHTACRQHHVVGGPRVTLLTCRLAITILKMGLQYTG